MIERCRRRTRLLRHRSRGVLIAGVLGIAAIAGPLGWGRAMAQTAAASGSVSDAIASLASGDREKVVAARSTLIGRLAGNPSANTLNTLARDLAAGVMPVVNGNDPHAKLNAAIVVQRLADATGSLDLAPAIARLINDESPAVAAFGLRASANVLPRVLGNAVTANQDVILPAITNALAKHAANEAVAIDAYTALTRVLAAPGAEASLGSNVVREATPRIVDTLLKVIGSRITDFGSGSVAEPGAEGQLAVVFLSKASTWGLMSEQQKTRTIGVLIGLLDATAAEYAAIKDPQGAGRPKIEGLRSSAKFTAQGLSVISSLTGKPASLKEAADKLQTSITVGTSPAQMAAAVESVRTAFVQAFPEAVAPATQPTAAPTTGG